MRISKYLKGENTFYLEIMLRYSPLINEKYMDMEKKEHMKSYF